MSSREWIGIAMLGCLWFQSATIASGRLKEEELQEGYRKQVGGLPIWTPYWALSQSKTPNLGNSRLMTSVL